MINERAGYREIEHTADWALEVWGSDRESLFRQAALGMYHLSGTRLEEAPRETKVIELEADDSESLLVSFLTELLFLGEQEGIGFDSFDLDFRENSLRATVKGSLISSQDKEIKAVTYHHINIQEGIRGFEVTIVFDV